MLTAELARTLSILSTDIRSPISLLFDRGGHVLSVTVGDAEVVTIGPSAYLETRLSGYTILHTHLGPRELSPADLSTLFLNRLDGVLALEVIDGQPGKAYLAMLVPPRSEEEDWRLFPPRPYFGYLNFEYGAVVRALEEELSRKNRARELLDGSGERVVLVGLDQGEGPQAEEDLAELAELVRTAGGVTVGQMLTYRAKLNPKFAVGRGKLSELISLAYHENAGTLIFGVDLTPAQARSLEEVAKLKVLDRTQLILDIFAAHARTDQAKAQVELAQLRYLLPRLVGKGHALSRLGGGIGTRGPGETQLELDRRKIQERIDHMSGVIRNFTRRQRTSRNSRRKSKMGVVGIVGYTNAGKTTLLRALCGGQGEDGEDKLFSTLGLLTRKSYVPGIGQVLLTDTVGFIRHMPDELMVAFRATLEELTEADVLIHMLDASREGALERHQVVQSVLAELEVSAPSLLVLNKIDLADQGELDFLQGALGGVLFSALRRQGIEKLRDQLAGLLEQAGVETQAWARSWA